MTNANDTETGQQVPIYNLNDLPSRLFRRGVIQRVFRGDQVAIGYNELHPGMATNPHSHDFEQVFILLQGRLKLHIGDQVDGRDVEETGRR